METTYEKLAEMTETGRLTVPREARRRVGVDGVRTTLKVEVRDGLIILRPVEMRPTGSPRLSVKARELIETARRAGKVEVTVEDLEALATAE